MDSPPREKEATRDDAELRVAMLVDSFPNPTETFIARQAQALRATVLTFDRRGASGGVPVVDLGPEGGWAGRLADRVRAYATRAAARASGDPWRWDPGRTRRFLAALDRVRPRVVLAQYGHTGVMASAPCAEAGVPLVVHFHGFDLSMLLRRRDYREALRRAIPRFAGFVAVNSLQAERLREAGAPEESIATIPYGAPLEDFRPSAAVGATPCVFLAVGRLVPKKAPLATIEAFWRCRKEFPDCRLVLVGDGPLGKQARELVFRLGVDDAVEFAGASDNATVRRIMGQASVFVQHSATTAEGDEEGWPVAIGEAMASGLPVVSTRHAGIADQVEAGRTGYLVPEGDVRGMAERMAELARSPALRQRLGAASRARIERVGDLTAQTAKLREFLERAAKVGAR